MTLRLISTWILVAALATTAFGADALRLDVRPHFQGHYRPGQWAAFTVHAAGTQQPVWVRLRDGRDPEGSGGIRYLPPQHAQGEAVMLPRRFEILATPGATTAPVVELLAGGPDGPLLKRQQIDDLTILGPRERLVVLVSDFGTSPLSFPRGKLDQGLTVRLARTTSGALPVRSEGYTPVDLLVFDNLRGRLSDQQRTALRRWLHGGGKVLIIGPRTFGDLEPALLGPRRSTSWTDLQRNYGATEDNILFRLTEDDSAPPVVIGLDRGFGRLVVFGLSYMPSDASVWVASAKRIYRDLLGRPPTAGDARLARPAYELHNVPVTDDAPPPDPQAQNLLGRLRTWALFYPLVLALVLAVGYRGRWRTAGYGLSMVAAVSVLYASAAWASISPPGARLRLFELIQFSADGTTQRHVSHLRMAPTRPTSAALRCRTSLPVVLAYDAAELGEMDHQVITGEPGRIADLGLTPQRPQIVAAEWNAAPESPTDTLTVRLQRPGGGAVQLRYQVPPSLAEDSTRRYDVLAFGQAWRVDRQGRRANATDGVSLRDFAAQVFGGRTDNPARQTRRRQAMDWAVRRFARHPYVLLSWSDQLLAQPWATTDAEQAEVLGSIRVFWPEVETEK